MFVKGHCYDFQGQPRPGKEQEIKGVMVSLYIGALATAMIGPGCNASGQPNKATCDYAVLATFITQPLDCILETATEESDPFAKRKDSDIKRQMFTT